MESTGRYDRPRRIITLGEVIHTPEVLAKIYRSVEDNTYYQKYLQKKAEEEFRKWLNEEKFQKAVEEVESSQKSCENSQKEP